MRSRGEICYRSTWEWRVMIYVSCEQRWINARCSPYIRAAMIRASLTSFRVSIFPDPLLSTLFSLFVPCLAWKSKSRRAALGRFASFWKELESFTFPAIKIQERERISEWESFKGFPALRMLSLCFLSQLMRYCMAIRINILAINKYWLHIQLLYGSLNYSLIIIRYIHTYV